MGCGDGMFFCQRKKKYGVNFQAAVDHKGRFIWSSIKYAGATSDYLAWETSDLRLRLAGTDLLRSGYTLVGDNAYVKEKYMATPIKGASPGLEDSYNFYHSQVRIIVECAFGMFVYRWGLLRRPLLCSFDKVVPLVMCLCRLHNFCINSGISESPKPRSKDETYNVRREA